MENIEVTAVGKKRLPFVYCAKDFVDFAEESGYTISEIRTVIFLSGAERRIS